MFNLVRQNFTPATVLQLLVELSWLFVIGMLVIYVQVGGSKAFDATAAPAFVFAALMLLLNGAFGIYGRQERAWGPAYALRLLLAPAIGVPLAYWIAEELPGGSLFQDHVGVVVLFAFGGLMLVRHMVVLPAVATLLPHRVMVLGTGPDARLVEASLAAAHPPGLRLVGFYPVAKDHDMAVSPGRVIAAAGELENAVRTLAVDEIIVAVRQQRGGVLPLRSMLECRLNGVQITDLAAFFERVHGKVPIESLKVSWLIYGDGYRQTWLRGLVKRAFDIAVSLAMIAMALPLMVAIAALIKFEGGSPIYRQTRVGRGGKAFTVLKFRTMARDAEKDGAAAWAAANDARITPLGKILRRFRMDELPQLFNVLRGDMSFVGPRPERPEFVAMLTEQIPFYAVRHSVKPGLTGWAQVRYSYGATVEQSVRKLEYDLYYVKNHTLVLDLVILLETIRVVLLGEGAR